MRVAFVVVLIAWSAAPVKAADPPARWQVRHTIPLDQPAAALAVGKSWAATGQADGTVRVWSLDTGKELATLTPPGKPGAIRALTGPADGTVLFGIEGERRGFLWDWSKPNGSRYVRHTFDGFVLDVTPDGKRWAVFDEDLRLESKNLASTVATPRLATVLVTTGDFRNALAAQLKDDASRVRGQFPPDGNGFGCFVTPGRLPRKVAWDDDDDLEMNRRVRRWDDRGEVSYVASKSPQFVTFSPDGKLAFAIGTRGQEFGQDGNLTGRVYSSTHIVNDGVRRGMILAEIRPFTPAEPGEAVTEVTGICHPWSGSLVTGATDGKVRFWDVQAALKDDKRVRIGRHRAGLADKPTDVLDAHAGSVRALRFTPDGLTLVTTGDDKCVVIWRPRP